MHKPMPRKKNLKLLYFEYLIFTPYDKSVSKNLSAFIPYFYFFVFYPKYQVFNSYFTLFNTKNTNEIRHLFYDFSLFPSFSHFFVFQKYNSAQNEKHTMCIVLFLHLLFKISQPFATFYNEYRLER